MSERIRKMTSGHPLDFDPVADESVRGEFETGHSYPARSARHDVVESNKGSQGSLVTPEEADKVAKSMKGKETVVVVKKGKDGKKSVTIRQK